MTKRVYVLLLALLCFCCVQLTASAASPLTIPHYGEFTASFSIPQATGNPYDPSVNDVDATFTNGKLAPVSIPAFWDGTKWCVRFAALAVGKYHLTLTYNGNSIAPDDLTASTFVCIPSDNPGFVHLDPTNGERFIFSNGTPYYPFGMDYAWQNGGQEDYPAGLAQYHDAGMNWARIWMNNWDGKNLEWAPTAPDNPAFGTYFLPAAQRWDMIIDNATHDGVYVQMTLQHHGQYTAVVDPNWSSNPFNVANGGWLKNPDDFFTDPKAIALTKAKYRYIVARYGYSTHIFTFELFNEVQNIREASSHFQDVVNWHNTMAAYIRSVDPYHHLITTSMSDPGTPLAAANIDFYQIHTYPPDIVSTLDNLPVTGSPKPVFVGEWGGGSGDQAAQLAFLHNGLWAGIMTPTAGGAQFWAWDAVQKDNSFNQFKSVSGYLTTYGVAELGGGVKLDASGTGNGPKGSLTFAPPGGWQPTTSLDVSIANNAVVTGLGGVSSFLQGTSHTDMQKGPINFHISPTQACQFTAHFGDVSDDGAHPTLSVDGGAQVELDFPATPKNHSTNGASLTVDLTPGTHVVSLGNTGSDWIMMQQIELTNFAPPIAVMAHGTKNAASFWAYSRRGYGTPLPADAEVTLGGLTPGKYNVRFWDCMNDAPLGASPVIATAAGLTIPLPTATSDIAGYVTASK